MVGSLRSMEAVLNKTNSSLLNDKKGCPGNRPSASGSSPVLQVNLKSSSNSKICFTGVADNGKKDTPQSILTVECLYCQVSTNVKNIVIPLVQCSHCHKFVDIICARLSSLNYTTLKKTANPVWFCNSCTAQKSSVNINEEQLDTLFNKFKNFFATKEDVAANSVEIKILTAKIDDLQMRMQETENSLKWSRVNNATKDDLEDSAQHMLKRVTTMLKDKSQLECKHSDDIIRLKNDSDINCKKIDEKVDYLNKVIRSQNLLLRNVPITINESTNNYVIKIGKLMNLDLVPNSNFNSYRTHSNQSQTTASQKNPVHPAAINIKFFSMPLKQQFYINYLKMIAGKKYLSLKDIGYENLNTRIYINEHLSKNNIKIFQEARKMKQEGKIVQVFTENGNIFIRRDLNGRRIKITTTNKLQAFTNNTIP